MRKEIHPEYKLTRITCACGRVSETYATVDELHVEICSHCHPFFTGRQKLVDTAGRVERFRRKYEGGAEPRGRARKKTAEAPAEATEAPAEATEAAVTEEPSVERATDAPDEPRASEAEAEAEAAVVPEPSAEELPAEPPAAEEEVTSPAE